MGISQSTPKNVKLSSDQIHANIRQLFQLNNNHDKFTETIGWNQFSDNAAILKGGNKFRSPQKRYEQYNINTITGQNGGVNINVPRQADYSNLVPLGSQSMQTQGPSYSDYGINSLKPHPVFANNNSSNFNSINMSVDKFSEISTNLSEIQLLKQILKQQTGGCGCSGNKMSGGCGCSDNKMSATSPQPVRYNTLKGGHVENDESASTEDIEKKNKNGKNGDKKNDESESAEDKEKKNKNGKNGDKKKDKKKESDDKNDKNGKKDVVISEVVEVEIDLGDDEDLEDDMDDIEDLDEELNDESDNIKRMTQDGSSVSSTSSENSSSNSKKSKKSKKHSKYNQSSSLSGGEINVKPFYSSESRSSYFKHLQKRNRFN
jgi:hypothetical protein